MTEENYLKIKARLKFDPQGLIPAIVQDRETGKVLTLCYLNEEALKKTLQENYVYVFRRSQNKLMKKGGSSGHVQRVQEFRIDCEGKSVLLIVDQHVAGCHRGYFSCYFERLDAQGQTCITDLPVFDPKKVY